MGQRQKLIDQLMPLLASAVSGPSSLEPDAIRKQFWFADIGGVGLSSEEAAALDEAVEVLARVFPRVGRQESARNLQRLVVEMHNRELCPGTPELAQRLDKELMRLRGLSEQRCIVFVQTCGLELAVPSWNLGPVVFLPNDAAEIEESRAAVVARDGTTPEPIPTCVVARIETVGDAEFAIQAGIRQAQLALDVVQFLSLPENPESWMAGGGPKSLLLTGPPVPNCPATVCCSVPDEEKWYRHSCLPPFACHGAGGALQLDATAAARFEKRGLARCAELLSTDAPTGLNESLITAVQWLAGAIRDTDLCRKYLAFFIALEAVFFDDTAGTRESDGFRPLLVPLDEGVAFLLGKTTAERQVLATNTAELRRLRNKIVHRGFLAIDETQLRRLGSYAWNCCCQLLHRRNAFADTADLKHWLAEQKYSTPDETPTGCTG